MPTAPVVNPPLPRSVVEAVWNRLDTSASSVEIPTSCSPDELINHPLLGADHLLRIPDDAEQIHRFRANLPLRQLWLGLLPEVEPDIRKIDRFRYCGRNTWVEQDTETRDYHLRSETCGLRICPACSRRIQKKAAHRVREYLEQNPNTKWQLITLTLRHSPTPLKDQLTRLVSYFRKLRQRKLWKTSVKTGYAVIETTFHAKGTVNPAGRLRESAEWHPHIHVLAQTDYLNWKQLHKDWRSITIDSTQIDCEKLHSPGQAARYISKYVTKPPSLDLANSPRHAAEWYHALKGRRLLIPFGPTSHHQPTPYQPRNPTTTIARLSDVIQAAKTGCYPAQCILVRLHLRLHPPYKHRPPDDQPYLPLTFHPP